VARLIIFKEIDGMKTAFADEPDFINEEGVKWWKSNPWRGRHIFHVEFPGGEKSIVALDKAGEVVAEDTSLDRLGRKIDAIAIANGEDLLDI
jgi:hypothetical protein